MKLPGMLIFLLMLLAVILKSDGIAPDSEETCLWENRIDQLVDRCYSAPQFKALADQTLNSLSDNAGYLRCLESVLNEVEKKLDAISADLLKSGERPLDRNTETLLKQYDFLKTRIARIHMTKEDQEALRLIAEMKSEWMKMEKQDVMVAGELEAMKSDCLVAEVDPQKLIELDFLTDPLYRAEKTGSEAKLTSEVVVKAPDSVEVKTVSEVLDTAETAATSETEEIHTGEMVRPFRKDSTKELIRDLRERFGFDSKTVETVIVSHTAEIAVLTAEVVTIHTASEFTTEKSMEVFSKTDETADVQKVAAEKTEYRNSLISAVKKSFGFEDKKNSLKEVSDAKKVMTTVSADTSEVVEIEKKIETAAVKNMTVNAAETENGMLKKKSESRKSLVRMLRDRFGWNEKASEVEKIRKTMTVDEETKHVVEQFMKNAEKSVKKEINIGSEEVKLSGLSRTGFSEAVELLDRKIRNRQDEAEKAEVGAEKTGAAVAPVAQEYLDPETKGTLMRYSLDFRTEKTSEIPMVMQTEEVSEGLTDYQQIRRVMDKKISGFNKSSESGNRKNDEKFTGSSTEKLFSAIYGLSEKIGNEQEKSAVLYENLQSVRETQVTAENSVFSAGTAVSEKFPLDNMDRFAALVRDSLSLMGSRENPSVSKSAPVPLFRKESPDTEENVFSDSSQWAEAVRRRFISGRKSKGDVSEALSETRQKRSRIVEEMVDVVYPAEAPIPGLGQQPFISEGFNPLTGVCLSYSEGVAPVEFRGKWGFADVNGKMVIQPEFDGAMGFSQGLAPVKTGGKWGFVNHNGKLVIRASFDQVFNFSDGFARVVRDNRWHYVSTEGRLFAESGFDYACDFSDGVAKVMQNGGWRYISKSDL